jgi:hypothetical protein
MLMTGPPIRSAGVCAASTRIWVARSDHALGDHHQERGRRRIGGTGSPLQDHLASRLIRR